jgi:hypothetical protein
MHAGFAWALACSTHSFRRETAKKNTDEVTRAIEVEGHAAADGSRRRRAR